jgi:DNA invertase Pin-like site-specific DNA recombinase
MAAIASLAEGDTLLVYKRDRLARDMMASLLANDLVKRQGGKIVSTQGEASDDDSPTGAFIKQVLDAVAEYERAMIKARMMAGRNAKKARGLVTTNVIPYGFRSESGKLIQDEREQAILAEVAALRAAGLSLRDISARLADQNMMARNGKPFSAKVLADLIKRAA